MFNRLMRAASRGTLSIFSSFASGVSITLENPNGPLVLDGPYLVYSSGENADYGGPSATFIWTQANGPVGAVMEITSTEAADGTWTTALTVLNGSPGWALDITGIPGLSSVGPLAVGWAVLPTPIAPSGYLGIGGLGGGLLGGRTSGLGLMVRSGLMGRG